MFISKEVAEAISHSLNVTPRAKAVAVFFNAEKVTTDGGNYIFTTTGYDSEKLEQIKYEYSIFCEVEKRITEAENRKADDDFMNMDDETYRPKELQWYAVPVMIDSAVRRLAEKAAKYDAHVKKDLETLSTTRHPEKYAARHRNHLAKMVSAQFERDVLLALAARFGVTVNA